MWPIRTLLWGAAGTHVNAFGRITWREGMQEQKAGPMQIFFRNTPVNSFRGGVACSDPRWFKVWMKFAFFDSRQPRPAVAGQSRNLPNPKSEKQKKQQQKTPLIGYGY